MKYIKIIYDEHIGEATKLEYPIKLEGVPVSRREAIQNFSELLNCLKGNVLPSPIKREDDCWSVILHKIVI